MKTKMLTMTMSEEQAEAIGFALMAKRRELEAEIMKGGDQSLTKHQLMQNRAAYQNLDTCPTI